MTPKEKPVRLISGKRFKGLRTVAGLGAKKTIIPIAPEILTWARVNHRRLGVCRTRLYNDLMSKAIKEIDPNFKGIEA